MTFGEILAKRAELNPSDVAVVFGDRRFTYRELHSRTNRLADALGARGLRKGARAAALMFNSSEFIEIYFALAKSGAVMVPVNFRLAPPEILHVLNDSGAEILFYGNEQKDKVEALKGEKSAVREFIPLGPVYDRLLDSGADRTPDAGVSMDDPQIIMYTSGTTGKPKGATLTHGNSVWNSINGIIDFGIRKDDVTLVCAPMFHVGALNILTTPHLHIGGRVVITSVFNPSEALKLIEKEKATNMFAVPTMFEFMLKAPEIETADLSSLRYFVTGGSPCPVPLIEEYSRRLGVVFLQGYGLTESSPSALLLKHEDALRKAGSVGKPFVHVDVKVVNAAGAPAAPGEVGEIIIRGPTVMKGYWNNPDATAEAVRGGWLYTGDLARVDDEGYIYIVDRRKDMIISGGENIYPAEIEAVLVTHDAVAEAGVIGVPDEKWGETPLALIVRKQDADPSPDEIIAFCRKNLAPYKCPKRIEFVESLPRTPTGKILKKELRETHGKGGGLG
ncbi:MAG: o-succinylbenzoate--CoA ligase [bacterium]